jgi:fructokinase
MNDVAPPSYSSRESPNPLAIGVDLGGTKIEAIALEHGDECGRVRVPTPRDDYEGTLAAIALLVARLEHQVGGRASVGMGIPGGIEPTTGLVKNANSVWLIGRPLKADLEQRLGRSVVVANDANCFALSEATDGAGAGADVVFGVILGTGVGGGIALGGTASGSQGRSGPNGVSGEWGHNPLPWMSADEYPGSPCYCGKHGCIESFLSGPALSADHQRQTGRALAVEDIVQRAQAGEPDADRTLCRYEHRAARALAGVINILDPDVIVLGGGVSNIDRLYTNIPRLWAEYVFACDARLDGTARDAARLVVRTPLRRARHGDSSGVRGAAWLGAVQSDRIRLQHP